MANDGLAIGLDVAHRCHDRVVSGFSTDDVERYNHPRGSRVAVLGWGPVGLTIGGLLAAVGAVVLLGIAIFHLYNAVVLASRGQVVQAEVVDVRYGTKADFVRVHLPVPIDRDVDLIRWVGRPRVGTSIPVRYDPSNPRRAEDDRSHGPGVDLVLAFVAGGVFLTASGLQLRWALRTARSRT
jgi:hypothetical protein